MKFRIRQIIAVMIILIGYYFLFSYVNKFIFRYSFNLITNWLEFSFLMFITMLGFLIFKNEIQFFIKNKKPSNKLLILPNKNELIYSLISSLFISPSIVGWLIQLHKF